MRMHAHTHIVNEAATAADPHLAPPSFNTEWEKSTYRSEFTPVPLILPFTNNAAQEKTHTQQSQRWRCMWSELNRLTATRLKKKRGKES